MNEDYGDTVPSRPPNGGLQVATEVKTSSSLCKHHNVDSVELAGEGMMSCLHVTSDISHTFSGEQIMHAIITLL